MPEVLVLLLVALGGTYFQKINRQKIDKYVFSKIYSKDQKYISTNLDREILFTG